MSAAGPEILAVLRELLDSGASFYPSAIEGDAHVAGHIDFDEWELRSRAAVAQAIVLDSALTERASGRKTAPLDAPSTPTADAPSDPALSVLAELLAALDDSVRGDDDVAAMLRYAKAEKAARALVSTGKGKSQ